MPGNEGGNGKGEPSRLVKPDGQPADQEPTQLPPFWQGGFALTVPSDDTAAAIQRCKAVMEVAPGVEQEVVIMRPDVSLLWLELSKGLAERDERIEELQSEILILRAHLKLPVGPLARMKQPDEPTPMCHKGCGRHGTIPRLLRDTGGDRIVYLCSECASEETPAL